jgi:hypothetical protein
MMCKQDLAVHRGPGTKDTRQRAQLSAGYGDVHRMKLMFPK